MFEASFISKCLCKHVRGIWGSLSIGLPWAAVLPFGQPVQLTSSLMLLRLALLSCLLLLLVHSHPAVYLQALFIHVSPGGGYWFLVALAMAGKNNNNNGNYAFTFILNKIVQLAVKLYSSLCIDILNVMPAKLRHRHVYHRVTSVFLWATVRKQFFFGFHPSPLFAEIIPYCLFTHSWTSLQEFIHSFKDVAFVCSHDSIACFQLTCFILKILPTSAMFSEY